MKNDLKLEENVNCGIITETIKQQNENEWKDIGKVSGIYKIINKINGKYYIGSSKNIQRRWNEHKSELNRGIHQNSYLQNSWNKYGENNFHFVIEKEVPKQTLIMEEQKYLDKIKNNRRKICYNLEFQTHGSPCENKSSKLKMIRSLKKYYETHSSPFLGKHHTEETKLKMKSNHPNVCGKNNSRFNKIIYNFSNESTKENFIGTQFDFRKKYNLLPSCVSELIKGKAKSTKNWILINPK